MSYLLWTLIFSSTGAYGEIFLIGCNSAKKAGMVIDYTIEHISSANSKISLIVRSLFILVS